MALNLETLQNDIQDAFEEILPDALNSALKATLKSKTEYSEMACKLFSETATKIIAEPLAKRLAAAIDYHVRSAEIYGTVQIITTGSPVTQQAILNVDTWPTGKLGGVPLVGGPNMLKLGIK